MANIHFSSATSEWATPLELFAILDAEFSFTLDPACTHENAKCFKHYTAGVINDIPDGSIVLGAPAIEANKAKRAYSLIGYLPEMRKNIRKLDNRLTDVEESE